MRSLWRIVRALVMALRGHRGQKDKAGKPYWHHLVTVALMAYGLTHDTEAVVVGLLHDYYEDVYPGRIELRFGVMTSVRCMMLTRLTVETYERYMDIILTDDDRVVHAVKLADLLHNTEPGRLPRGYIYACEASSKTHPSAGLKRSLRYQKAIERLVNRRLEESRL